MDKQREVYEAQLLKLSANDPESLRLKLMAELDLKYKQAETKGKLEIEEAIASMKAYQRQYELLKSEYDIYKRDSIRELNAFKDMHQSELRDLLGKVQLQAEKESLPPEKESNSALESQLASFRIETEGLKREIASLRKEKEELLIDKNELKLTSGKEIDKEGFHNKMLIAENERLTQQSYKLQEYFDELKRLYEEKVIENNALQEDKAGYEAVMNEQSKEYASFKEEMIQLRNQLEQREREMDHTLQETHQKTQMALFKDIADKDTLLNQIDALSLELTALKLKYKKGIEYLSNELHEASRDCVIAKETSTSLSKSNRELSARLEKVSLDFAGKASLVETYEKDYHVLQEKYRDLAEKEQTFNSERQGLEGKLTENRRELKHMNAYIESLKADKQSNSAVKKKYLDVLEKKKYYKAQCKAANANIMKLISKLQPNEREIETLYMREHEQLYNQSEESGA